MNTDKLLSVMDSRADELYALLIEYLSVKSENGDEKRCAERVYKHWEELGLSPSLYSTRLTGHPEFREGRDSDNRPNVTARINGKTGMPTLMLLAHTDTVSIGDPFLWHKNPLGEISDGRIYGRGANDNKFGLACMTFIARIFKDLEIEPENDILLTAYSDEEFGGNGALAACVDYPCDAYINLDGGNGELWNVALGGQAIGITVTSNETLDSSERIAEALYTAMKMLRPFGEKRRKELHNNIIYANTDMQRSAYRITGFKAGDMACDLNKGRLMLSIYTDSSQEQIWHELAQIQNKLIPEIEQLGLQTKGFEPMSRFFHYYETVDKLGLLNRMNRAAQIATGKTLNTAGSCLTDLDLMLRYGSPNSFNFGLIRDFMLPGGAHQPDEFVDCKMLLDYTKTLTLFCVNK